ncbi:MAG: hypothetical protein M3Y87_24845 [Myxococcota bacterium]|nr:hypothetical protein [Myxococcota bacterium]
MHAVRVTIATSALLMSSGCYLFHGLDGESGPATFDASRPDASAVAERDAAISRVPDAAGPPLPAEPDPDLGPDARPSDYPDADEWEEPPAPGADDPCCTMDDPIRQ